MTGSACLNQNPEPNPIRRYMKGHPEATMAEAARGTGHGINTVRRYRAVAAGNEDSEVFKIGEKITKKGLREFNDCI